MDFFSALTLFIILLIVFSLCGFCCRSKRKGTIFSSLNFQWRPVIIVFTTCIIICRLFWWCCRKLNRSRESTTPVVVTSATHTAPGGYPTTGMQTVSVYPTSCSTTGYQQNVYPQQTPYPVSGGPSGMPMPMPQSQMHPNPIGMNQQGMPPYPMAGPVMNPPSYESAVGPNPHPNPNQTGYEKQSPYNPSYATGY